MDNNLITAPIHVPDMVITTGFGVKESEKYQYNNIILNSFVQEIKKGSLWKNTGDVYKITFASIPENLKTQLEHGGYQILEIKFVFVHRNLDKNCCDVEKEIVLTNPSIYSNLIINTTCSSIYDWTIYNTWIHGYEQRD